MACREEDFKIGDWKAIDLNGHKLEVATTENSEGILPDVLFRLDGVFQGVVGSEEAAIWWAGKILTEKE